MDGFRMLCAPRAGYWESAGSLLGGAEEPTLPRLDFSRTIPAEFFGSREIPAFFPQTWIA
jgi:hypothetical protein